MRGGLFRFGGCGPGQGGGFGFLGGGGGVAWEELRGLGGGVNQQLDNWISSSAKPSHPNSPRLAQHGVFGAQVSVRRRDGSHSRKLDKIEQLVAGCGGPAGTRADRLNSAVGSR